MCVCVCVCVCVCTLFFCFIIIIIKPNKTTTNVRERNILFNDALNTLTSPYRLSLLYGHGTTPLKVSKVRSSRSNHHRSKSRKREREMFYLTTHSTHFIYGYMASDIWLRTILIVRKETRCRHIGYSYRLTARVLLYAPSHR